MDFRTEYSKQKYYSVETFKREAISVLAVELRTEL
jgi:hypothetical protein